MKHRKHKSSTAAYAPARSAEPTNVHLRKVLANDNEHWRDRSPANDNLYRKPAPGMRSAMFRIDVPKDVASRVPKVIRYVKPQIKEHPSRHRRVALFVGKPTVPKVVQIDYPKALPVVDPHYVGIRREKLVLHSSRARTKLLLSEPNRKRRSELKGQRKKFWHGHLGSLKHDRYGIVGAALKRGASVRDLSVAALVSRSMR